MAKGSSQPPEKTLEPYAGSLYLVGTPIGNLEDISFRALRILKGVDWVAAEDTRHSGVLLHHFQIKTHLISYHNHNRIQRTPELVQALDRGESGALITDAGMPGISDPGEDLVQACIVAGIPVVPIPGPTAFVSALVASGLSTERFVFEGFLPSHPSGRRQHLACLTQETRTLIFYEAPHRLRETLRDMVEVFGSDRPVVIARELTKRFETFWRGSLQMAVDSLEIHPPKGEITLVVRGGSCVSPKEWSDEEILTALQTLVQQGLSRSQASRHLAEAGVASRRKIYHLSLQLTDLDPDEK
jgi:16S rRNA (cytidine1402-2'-O)-methyltransferase